MSLAVGGAIPQTGAAAILCLLISLLFIDMKLRHRIDLIKLYCYCAEEQNVTVQYVIRKQSISRSCDQLSAGSV